MEPLIVRLFIPLSIAITLFLFADFAFEYRALTLANSTVSPHQRRLTGILGITWLLLLTVLGIVAAITFIYRREVSQRRVAEQEAVATGAPRPRQTLDSKIRREKLAFFVPVVVGTVGGLALRRIERSKRQELESDFTAIQPR